jgi:hypothetical protein
LDVDGGVFISPYNFYDVFLTALSVCTSVLGSVAYTGGFLGGTGGNSVCKKK